MYLTIICEYYSQLCGFYANVSLLDRLLGVCPTMYIEQKILIAEIECSKI